MIEEKLNEYGQLQKIDNFDTIIKHRGRLIQVRLIETKFYNQNRRKGFTKPMPRAKFIKIQENNPYYLIRKNDLEELRSNQI